MCKLARGGRSPSWLCCNWIAQVQRGFPCGGHKTSGVKLPIAELLWTGSCFPLCHRLAGPCFPYATHLRGRVTLMPHTHRAVFPSCHHLQGHVPLMPHTRGPAFPLCHHLAGPCFLYATHSWAVFPLCHSLARLCSPFMPLTSKVVFPPYATH